ncbi:MAG: family 16 glycoside hydrolase [Prosthecobacter sp.]|uniref:family 16 glycoside hydrolase n=1 Tax=Prosthecobacter sp. TaxID=1965333 RepID=UPI0039042EB2
MKALLSILFATSLHAAVEPGFVSLFEGPNASAWQQSGPGQMKIANGIATCVSPSKWGVAVFGSRSFADFTLKLEFKGMKTEFNSGVWLRIPSISGEINALAASRYEVGIRHSSAGLGRSTGAIWGLQPAFLDTVRTGDWNEMEVTVSGQRYTVKLNGQTVNDFTGSKSLSGYIGLESNAEGPVQFRNVRIKDLTAPSTEPAAPLAMIQTDANQPRIEVIKDQGPNATEWALTPLDEAIPADIRQNLTFLREDLLDEGKKAAKSSPEAYKLATDYCDKLLAALSQREIARVQAGYQAAQADANKATSTQALDARRNHQMSWPQFSREESQRAALRETETNKADVKKQRLTVEWATRAEQMRSYLDNTYRQLREAMR